MWSLSSILSSRAPSPWASCFLIRAIWGHFHITMAIFFNSGSFVAFFVEHLTSVPQKPSILPWTLQALHRRGCGLRRCDLRQLTKATCKTLLQSNSFGDLDGTICRPDTCLFVSMWMLVCKLPACRYPGRRD